MDPDIRPFRDIELAVSKLPNTTTLPLSITATYLQREKNISLYSSASITSSTAPAVAPHSESASRSCALVKNDFSTSAQLVASGQRPST